MPRSTDDLHVIVELYNDGSLPHYACEFHKRHLILTRPNWSVEIGRSTSSEAGGPQARHNNACFSSKVVSREHAVITADPQTRKVFIRDVGSMHGTHRDGQRLPQGELRRLYDGDKLVLGAEVARGESTFFPVELEVAYFWSDEDNMASSSNKVENYSRNSFSVDYSDFSSDEIEEAEPPRHDPMVEVIIDAPRPFAVPESDTDSEIVSISDDSADEPESPTSSPLGPEEAGAPKVTETTLDIIMREEQQKALEVPESTSVVNLRDTDPRVQSSESPLFEATADQESLYADEDVFDGSMPKHRPWKLRTTGTTPPIPHNEVESADNDRTDHRQPSPSDAAMAKPPQPSTRAPPFAMPAMRLPGIDQVTSTLSPHATLGSDIRNCYAWAGQNAVLYEAPAVPRQENSYWTPADTVPAYQDYDWAATSQWNTPMPAEFQAPSTCVARPAQVVGESSVKAGKKRKLDEVEEATAVSIVSTPEQYERLPTESLSNEAQVPDSLNTGSQTYNLLPIEVSQTIDSLKSPRPPGIASPRKKHKKCREDSGARHTKRGSGFARLAATALAGAAVGVAGTIFGLVALPPDFFV